MKVQEFSDTFTTLLNSYNTQAGFGEQASKRDIVLDEYEKSVLLTQAQDIIVKSYFDGTLNSQGQGFDDSARRQVDFSSLIKVEDLQAVSSPTVNRFDERGYIFQMPRKKNTLGVEIAETTDVLFILNEKLIVSNEAVSMGFWYKIGESTVIETDTNILAALNNSQNTSYNSIAAANVAGWKYQPKKAASQQEYVIVPISYKEYDREMSKPYAQPLKKQAWRLFQNSSAEFDVNTELIPKHTVTSRSNLTYRIRYVRRPRPIILETLPNDLKIDGEYEESNCELNPIIHMDILNKAVELAIATRGGGAAERGVPPSNNMKQTNN